MVRCGHGSRRRQIRCSLCAGSMVAQFAPSLLKREGSNQIPSDESRPDSPPMSCAYYCPGGDVAHNGETMLHRAGRSDRGKFVGEQTFRIQQRIELSERWFEYPVRRVPSMLQTPTG